MKKRSFSATWAEYENLDELPAGDRELVQAAIEASGKAYAPYSRFNVGAALRLDNGLILNGSNVENAAFPSGVCAERTVLAYSVSNYPDNETVAIAIAATTDQGLSEEPVPPCGNCRQVIAEEEFRKSNDIKVILCGKARIMVFEKGGDLLPLQFNRDNLRPVLP